MNTEEHDFTDTQALRLKAEELLKRKQLEADLLIKETDMKKLVHELQVHQIELEMQNEELRQAYEAEEAAKKKATMLYDLSPLGYLTIDQNGTIEELNFSASDMLGEKRFGVVGSNFKLYLTDESKAVFSYFLEKVFINNEKESCEVMLGYDDTSLCQVYIEGIVTGDEQKCLLSVVDISSFKK